MRVKLLVAVAVLGVPSLWAQVYALKTPIAQKPALLTSVGQSADLEIVKILLEKASIPYKADTQLKAADLAASGAKTLILVIGGSTKGLGAAGISADVELDRAKAVMAQAKKSGIPIIGLHVGGEARRGELSDKFIQLAIPACNYVIVVAEGDKDGLFEKLAAGKIPIDKVERTSRAADPLQKAFR